MKTQRPKSASGRKPGGVSSSKGGKRHVAPPPPAPPHHLPGHPCLTIALVEALCNHIASGKSLRSWCAIQGHPSQHVIFRALREVEQFREQYTRAREDQADTFVDQCIEIADDGRNDTFVDDEGKVQVDTDVIQRTKIRLDERHWQAGKMKPKLYGDKVAVQIEKPPAPDAILGERDALLESLARLGYKRG